MVKVRFEINTVLDEDGTDWETEYSEIDTADLIGAEIIETIDNAGLKPERITIEELRLRLKDGRIIRIAPDDSHCIGRSELYLCLWSDDQEARS
jgi:hypothetical protein